MGRLSFLSAIGSLLAHKRTGRIILAAVILGRALQLVYLFSTRNDMTYQILAAQNLVEGQGLSTPNVLPEDLSLVHYDTLTRWPPGFSWIFVPFYLLCGKDYVLAAILLSVAAAFLLVFATRRILQHLELSAAAVNLGTLLTGFTLYAFYLKCCTDALAISLLAAAFALLLSLLRPGKRGPGTALLLSLLLIGSASVKYLYFPVVFLFPAYLIAVGLRTARPELRKSGTMIMGLLILGLGAIALYLYSASGQVGYIKEPQRGWFPENLKAIYPFFPAGLLKPETLAEAGLSSSAGRLVIFVYQLIHLAAWALLLFLAARLFVRNRNECSAVREHFLPLSLLVSTGIALVLVYLSLRVAKEPVHAQLFWTYVEEARYYGWILVLVPVGFFLLFERARNPTLRRLALAGILLASLEAARGLVFTANRVRMLGREEYGWQYERRFQRDAHRIITAQKQRDPGRPLVLCGSSDWMNLRAALYTRQPLLEDLSGLANQRGGLHTTAPVQLVFILRESDRGSYHSFLGQHGWQLVGRSSGFSFYSLSLNPASLP